MHSKTSVQFLTYAKYSIHFKEKGWCTHACVVLFCGCVLNSIWLFTTLWTVTCQAPLSMGFFRQENWSQLLFPRSGELPNPGIDPAPLVSRHCRQILYPLSYQGSPCVYWSDVKLLSRVWLCNPMDFFAPVHGILQVRILEWVAVPFSSGSSHHRDWTQVSTLQADSIPSEPLGKPHMYVNNLK